MSGGVRVKLKVISNAPQSEVVRWSGGELTVKLAAPPVEGKANRELVKFLARLLGVSGRDVKVLRGDTSRHKTVSITGVSAADAQERIKRALA